MSGFTPISARQVLANVTTDSTTTGAAATIQSTYIVNGVVRLTNASLTSVSGIPAASAGQTVTIENQTGNNIFINNNDSGASSGNRIYTGTGANIAMGADTTFEFLYDGTVNQWMLLGSAASGSGSGSGSGKNYLSAYTASTGGGVANIGNGNFELGSVTGWSLGTIGALTNRLPTGTPTFGSGASGNLSISTVTGGSQIGGTYSLSYASSAATTQGNMVASNAFYIDAEDQAKVLTVKFYYSVPVGASNDNFSGTSSNSFAWAAYDVTNSSWLSSAGNFNLIQDFGTGYVTGTFQTNINTTEIRFVIYNANATSGATTLYIDDIFVGPQTAPSGPAMTDWIAYTPTGVQTGSITYQGYWRRVGDSMEINASAVFGGAPTGTFGIKLPSGYSVDITKIQSQADSAQGIAVGYIGSGASYTGTVRYFSSDSALEVEGPNNVARWDATIPGTFSSTGNITINAIVPIVGWSSNTSMSSDTDTRVVAASMSTLTSTTATSGTALKFTTISYDTHAACNAANGTFTVPVSGYYRVSTASIYGSATLSDLSVYKNGSIAVGSFTTTNNISRCNGSVEIQLVAGDILTFVPSVSVTYGDTLGQVYFERLSGPAVIAATESVNARYYGATGTLNSGTDSLITFSTKSFDTHNTYANGIYTIPVTGKYQINARTVSTDTSVQFTAGISIYQNGTEVGLSYTCDAYVLTGGNYDSSISDIISCLAGDQIEIKLNNNGTSPSLTSSNTRNIFTIARVGN